LTDQEWLEFDKKGYFHLGQTLSDQELSHLRQRLDDIMLGKIQYNNLLMQLDPGQSYGDQVQSEQTTGWKGETLDYRKIGDAQRGLECDDLFTKVMQKEIFQKICGKVYGPHADIAVYRAMVMNKPAGKGTDLPWHQDGGDWWGLDRDPLVFVWIALDDVSAENGGLEVLEGSHRMGLITPRGHTVQWNQMNLIREGGEEEEKYKFPHVTLQMKKGEAVLCHNWIVHRSGVNKTMNPRRAFSVNYIDARTQVRAEGPLGPCGKSGEKFPLIFPGTFGYTKGEK